MNEKLYEQLGKLNDACVDLHAVVQTFDSPLPKEVATVYNLSETLRIMIQYAIEEI